MGPCLRRDDVKRGFYPVFSGSYPELRLKLVLRTDLTCQQAFADAAQLMARIEVLPDLLGAGLPLL